MVNFHDSALIAKESAAYLNFLHCLDGIYIWEFLISLKFDLDHLTGKREFKWTFVLYFLSRIGALGSMICNLIGSNITHRINCQLWNICYLTLGYTAFACASVLIALRVIAIWGPNRFVATIAITTCLTNIGLLIYGVATLHSTWSLIARTCVLENSFQSRDTITATMTSNITLLILMSVGLLRARQTSYGIVRQSYIQGLIWFAAATIAGVPAAVFINLNLNDTWNVMFQTFAFFAMIICATRMYRAPINNDMEVEKYNGGPSVHSRLRFEGTFPKGTTMSAPSNSALPKSHFETSYPRTEDVELNLTEKTAAVGDEEA